MKTGSGSMLRFFVVGILLIAGGFGAGAGLRSARPPTGRVVARAAALDSFCSIKQRVLEVTAERIGVPAHRAAAEHEFSDVFLSDDGQEAMILCLGLPAWQAASPEGRALTCSAAGDVACMATLARNAAAALGSAAAAPAP